jgi:hypothetical protein
MVWMSQDSGVWSAFEWSAKQATDKFIRGSQVDADSGVGYLLIDYTVPADKTFYITGIGASIADDFSLNSRVTVEPQVGAIVWPHFVFTGGGYYNLRKPWVVGGGETISVYGSQWSGKTVDTLEVFIVGWEE